jgi:hypothetical protein
MVRDAQQRGIDRKEQARAEGRNEKAHPAPPPPQRRPEDREQKRNDPEVGRRLPQLHARAARVQRTSRKFRVQQGDQVRRGEPRPGPKEIKVRLGAREQRKLREHRDQPPGREQENAEQREYPEAGRPQPLPAFPLPPARNKTGHPPAETEQRGVVGHLEVPGQRKH